MGWWGENLFQSDQDYDIIDDFSEEAGVELFSFEKEEDKATATKALDDGKFNELFDKIKAEPSSDYDFIPAKYKLVILTALAMQLGAKIDTKKRKHVQRIYKHTGQLMDGAMKQLEKALKGYEDGTPWGFEDSL